MKCRAPFSFAQVIRSISTTSKRSNLTCLQGLAAHKFTGARGKVKRSIAGKKPAGRREPAAPEYRLVPTYLPHVPRINSRLSSLEAHTQKHHRSPPRHYRCQRNVPLPP